MVMCSSLFSESRCFVIASVSVIGMLTCKSVMSNLSFFGSGLFSVLSGH